VCHLHTPFALIAELEGLARTADVRLADAMERRAARRSDLVLTASLPLARRLQQTRWWPRDDIEPREMPPAVEPSEWQGRTPVSKTKPLVLAVGRLERVKRPEDLVEAVATLQARIPGIEVALVGRSGLREGRDYGRWLERFARDRGVRCHLTGQASRAEVREWVDRARVVAIPSSFEGLPLFAIEAMTAGRPVICTDQTGVADVVKGSGGGVVVPVGETLELAEALSVYLDDPEEAERAGRRGRDAVASLCAPDTVAQQREAAYRDAIEARRRRSRRYSIPWGRKV
jgi:glycosyltransferase involved in cell wall biosynthesis